MPDSWMSLGNPSPIQSKLGTLLLSVMYVLCIHELTGKGDHPWPGDEWGAMTCTLFGVPNT